MGAIIKPGSGIGIKPGSGLVSGTEDTACCCQAGVPCANCTGTTPATVDITVQSIALCTCANAGGGFWVTAVYDPNGTHTLTQVDGDPCRWRKVVTTTVARIYTNSGCTALAETVSSVQFVLLRQPSNVWRMTISCQAALVPSMALFGATLSGDANCMAEFSMNNSLTACAGSFGAAFGIAEDGSVDLTPQ